MTPNGRDLPSIIGGSELRKRLNWRWPQSPTFFLTWASVGAGVRECDRDLSQEHQHTCNLTSLAQTKRCILALWNGAVEWRCGMALWNGAVETDTRFVQNQQTRARNKEAKGSWRAQAFVRSTPVLREGVPKNHHRNLAFLPILKSRCIRLQRTNQPLGP